MRASIPAAGGDADCANETLLVGDVDDGFAFADSRIDQTLVFGPHGHLELFQQPTTADQNLMLSPCRSDATSCQQFKLTFLFMAR